MSVPPSHIERLLGRPELTRLVDLLVRRLERGLPLGGVVIVKDVASAERSSLAALFGRSPGSGGTFSVDLARLDDIVRTSGAAASLAAAVEALRGPIVVHAERLEVERQAWSAAVAALGQLDRRPEYSHWAASNVTRATIRRLTRTPESAAELIRRVVGVLIALPADGESLRRFASRTLGSTHALDVGTPEAALVLSALGGGLAEGGAERRRELWGSAGVVVDEISSTVLVHRLALPGPLGELTQVGEPVILTLRHLRTLDIEMPKRPVFVCENPSVVDAAASYLGSTGAPLVCLQGQPSMAAELLLRRIAGAGLRYHGDFDWGGFRIGNRLHSRHGFEPWRFGSADLLAAAEQPGDPLVGQPVDARWDPGLRGVLERRGWRLEEEQVLERLLIDLADT